MKVIAQEVAYITLSAVKAKNATIKMFPKSFQAVSPATDVDYGVPRFICAYCPLCFVCC
jgi:hypothetical protein